MSQLKILDSGYVANADISGQTQIQVTERAGYTGSTVSAFTFNNGSTGYSGGQVNNENKPIIDNTDNPNTTLISKGNSTISVALSLLKSTSAGGFNVNQLYQISRLDKTQGLKLLYPSSVGDTKPTNVEALGGVNINGFFADASPTDAEGTVSTTTPYLVGRVKGLSIGDSADGNYWRITFTFEITG